MPQKRRKFKLINEPVCPCSGLNREISFAEKHTGLAAESEYRGFREFIERSGVKNVI